MNRVFQKRTFGKKISSPQIIAVSFLIIIITGAVLLMLPFSSRSGETTPFSNCLFTATSATCVTGLVTFDTFTYWSYFGQAVIIILIQIGGLGFMTLTALFSAIIRKKLSLKEKMTMIQSFSVERTGIHTVIKRIVFGSLLTEAAGGVILTSRLSFDYGFPMALYKGFFTSISAFCNAGFDLFGDRGEFSSLSSYSGDPVVILTVSALIICGGLGFFIWSDILSGKKFKRYSVLSKTVIITTAALLLFSALSFFALEHSDAAVIGDSAGENILQSVFFASTLRTAGFSAFDFSKLKETTAIIAIFMMFIGGGSGSTAGGIKVSTFALILFTVKSALKGGRDAYIGKKRIAAESVIRTVGLVFILFFAAVFSGIVISEVEGVPLLPSLFETFSAVGTVGLSMGLTPSLSVFSLYLLSVLMFLGRVGVLTVVFALNIKDKNEGLLSFPETKFAVG